MTGDVQDAIQSPEFPAPADPNEDMRSRILAAAADVFGARGYRKGSLEEVARKVGITRQGVLHHFGSKAGLLLAILEDRDRSDLAKDRLGRIPEGPGLFTHLKTTMDANEDRRVVVQLFTVLLADSLTADHPASAWFRDRYSNLRGEVVEALRVVAGPGAGDDVVLDAADGIIAVMDGLQIQWLMHPDAVSLGRASARAIDALVASVQGSR